MEGLGKKKSNNDYWKIIKLKAQEKKIIEAFELFRRNEIEPVLIKGWATAINYPLPENRIFADLDFSVNPEQFFLAGKILSENKKITSDIDLHRGLRHLDTLEWKDLFANTILKKMNGAEVRILCPEDHLRVICVHWLNDGGASRERLWDIYYAVKNRPKSFDWNRSINSVDEERRFWIVSAIMAAHRYLKLEISDIPLKSEEKNIPFWLIRTIESEWRSEIQLLPLKESMANKKNFIQQVIKRIPPNPIQATVETGGSFKRKPRFYYQVINLIQRVFRPGKKKFLLRFWVNRNEDV